MKCCVDSEWKMWSIFCVVFWIILSPFEVYLFTIESVMRDVVKERLCSSDMSTETIEEVHECLRKSSKSGNRIQSECIKSLHPFLPEYYIQLCNQSINVENSPQMLNCMKEVCRQKGFHPQYDRFYCNYIDHDDDSDCGLLALNVPESIKTRAMVAFNVTQEFNKVSGVFCNKMKTHLIHQEIQRLRTTECLILPRKHLYRKCAIGYREKHSKNLDPEVFYRLACDHRKYTDEERWVSSSSTV